MYDIQTCINFKFSTYRIHLQCLCAELQISCLLFVVCCLLLVVLPTSLLLYAVLFLIILYYPFAAACVGGSGKIDFGAFFKSTRKRCMQFANDSNSDIH